MSPEGKHADSPLRWLENARADLALAEGAIQWAEEIVRQEGTGHSSA